MNVLLGAEKFEFFKRNLKLGCWPIGWSIQSCHGYVGFVNPPHRKVLHMITQQCIGAWQSEY